MFVLELKSTGMEDRSLPYRISADDLVRFVEARARGRDRSQIMASLNLSQKALSGLISAAVVLQLVDSDTVELTQTGQLFALAGDTERRDLLLKQISTFEPYELLVEAIFNRDGERVTPLNWIETWWSTHEYGTSNTNREEASTSFARLIEFVRLGSYVQGRHGHASRIEWSDEAPNRWARVVDPGVRTAPAESLEKADPKGINERDDSLSSNLRRYESEQDVGRFREVGSVLSLQFSEEKKVEIRVPPALTLEEKERLLNLIDLMISTE